MPDTIAETNDGGELWVVNSVEVEDEHESFEPSLGDRFRGVLGDLISLFGTAKMLDGSWCELPIDFRYKYTSMSVRLDTALPQIGAVTPLGNQFIWYAEGDELKVTTFPKDGGLLRGGAYTRTMSEKDFKIELEVPLSEFSVRQPDPVEVLEAEILNISTAESS